MHMWLRIPKSALRAFNMTVSANYSTTQTLIHTHTQRTRVAEIIFIFIFVGVEVISRVRSFGAFSY